jgi:hypothetical protein
VNWRALGLGLWLLGCAGTETGNPSFDGTVGYDAYTSQPQMVALRGQSEASVIVDAAWLVLGDVQIGSSDSCGSEPVVDVPGLGVGDHVGSQAPVTHVELPAGAHYCEVSIALGLAEETPAAAPAELAGHSILVSGTHEGRAFRISSAMDRRVSLSVRPAEGFVLDADYSGLLFGFDLARWLKDLPWSKASTDADGTLLIDTEHSPEALRAFEAQVDEGIGLFTDPDGDGKRDANQAAVALPE